MSTLQEYINGLISLEANMDIIISKAILGREGTIVGWIKNRLYQRGIKGDGTFIGNYSPGYEALKRIENKRASHITLRDGGDFYAGMFVRFEGSKLFINSTDSKTPTLVKDYGESILDLTEEEKIMLIDVIIEPLIFKHIQDLGNIISMGSNSGNLFSASN